jgi:hypothetical protein
MKKFNKFLQLNLTHNFGYLGFAKTPKFWKNYKYSIHDCKRDNKQSYKSTKKNYNLNLICGGKPKPLIKRK